MKRKAILPQVVLLPFLVWLVWSTDVWTAVSLSYPGYVVMASMTCGLLLLPWALVRRSSILVIPCLWLAFLCVLPWVPNTSLKPLMWGVRDLEPGMDREAVLETLNRAYAGTGHPRPLVHAEEQCVDENGEGRATRMMIKPQGRDPELQAECLLVFFADGGFTRTVFWAD